jgi:uncharacterized Zn finger protein
MLITHCACCARDTGHEVIRESSGGLVVRCTACQMVQTMALPAAERPLVLKTIVSAEGESLVCSIESPVDEELRVGSVLVAECGEDAYGVEITSIEQAGRRVEKSRAGDVVTLWTRVVDRVVVKASVHEGRNTVPVYAECEGDDAFVVGESYEFAHRPFRISHIKLRDGGLLRRNGMVAPARNVKRIYGYRV